MYGVERVVENCQRPDGGKKRACLYIEHRVSLRNASVKTVPRENQLKYVEVEGMRVVTNNRCIAEQIKNDKAENVVMDRPKIGEFGTVGREQILKSVVMNGVKN